MGVSWFLTTAAGSILYSPAITGSFPLVRLMALSMVIDGSFKATTLTMCPVYPTSHRSLYPYVSRAMMSSDSKLFSAFVHHEVIVCGSVDNSRFEGRVTILVDRCPPNSPLLELRVSGVWKGFVARPTLTGLQAFGIQRFPKVHLPGVGENFSLRGWLGVR